MNKVGLLWCEVIIINYNAYRFAELRKLVLFFSSI
jgi:hypothetical protein